MMANTPGRFPAFKLPALACDAHCHVFGPAAMFPYAQDRRSTPEDAPKEALIAQHDRLGLQRAVIARWAGLVNRAGIEQLGKGRIR